MTAMKQQAISLITSEMKPLSVKHVLLENVLNPRAGQLGPKVNTPKAPLQLARP